MVKLSYPMKSDFEFGFNRIDGYLPFSIQQVLK